MEATEVEGTTEATEPVDAQAAKLRALKTAIDEQRKKREQVEEARRKAFEIEDAERELEAATRQAEEEEVILETEQKHGREGKGFARVNAVGGMILLRKPNHLRWRRFVDSGKTDSATVQKVTEEHLLYPDPQRFSAMVEEHVDTLRICGNALARLHGTRAKEELPGK